MFAKITAFFKNFFRNAAADPVSTGKGAVQIAAGGAAVYGMATGKVPVNEMTVGFVTATTASGLHAIGSDTAAAKVDQVSATLTELAPVIKQGLTVAEHYEEIRKQAGNATAVLAAVSEGVATLAADSQRQQLLQRQVN